MSWIVFKLKDALIYNTFETYTTTTGDKIALKFHKEVKGNLVVIDTDENMYIEERENKEITKYTLLSYYIKKHKK